MPTYKLTYFNITGRAEVSRWLLTLAGQKFEDKRVTSEEWQKMKADTPFGALPTLEIDGSTVIAQTLAIVRYLAKQFGYAGKNALEEAKVDMIAYCIDELQSPLPRYRFEKDEAQKALMKTKLEGDTLPNGLAKLEKMLKCNKGGDGYFVGDGMTFADMNLAAFFDWFEFFQLTVDTSKYPKLSALKKRVEANPKIADWIAKRPS